MSYPHLVDTWADSGCLHQFVPTASLTPRWLVPINTHICDITYFQQQSNEPWWPMGRQKCFTTQSKYFL